MPTLRRSLITTTAYLVSSVNSPRPEAISMRFTGARATSQKWTNARAMLSFVRHLDRCYGINSAANTTTLRLFGSVTLFTVLALLIEKV